MTTQLPLADLLAGVDEIRRSPTDRGALALIVRRPAVGAREVLEEAELDVTVGLVGDTWTDRPSRTSADGGPHPEMQLNIMNARVALLVAAGDVERRALCGDQLYVDLDLSSENLPAGTQLSIGGAVVEITAAPHRGCAKFSERFGADAVRFVNSPDGLALNLRGVNAKVIQPGRVATGDVATKRSR